MTGDPSAPAPQYLAGGPGDDELVSRRPADVIHYPGYDIFQGDYLDGGDGDDRLDAVDATWAYLDGGDGHDVLLGGAEARYLAGGPGDDTVDGGAPYLDGGDGNDTLTGDAGAPAPQYLDGGPGDDTLTSKRPADGGAGDFLDGGAGHDLLTGGEASETLLGGDGDDILFGGAGADVFLADAGDDSLLAIDGEADTYFDCGVGHDLLLADSAADANTGRSGCEYDPNAPPDGGGRGPGGGDPGGGDDGPLRGDVNGDGRVRWAILGDSYISGEGLTTPAYDVFGNEVTEYWEDTDSPTNRCHRAATSWAFGLAQLYGATGDDLRFLACSGATTENFDSRGQYGQAPQVEALSAFADDGDVDVVLVSIGGNDAGFADVIAACLWPEPYFNAYTIWGPSISTRCNPAKDEGWVDWLAKTVARQLFNIRAAAPGARIFLANYVNPTNPPASQCGSLGGISEAERTALTKYIENVNGAVKKAADAAGAHPIDLKDEFRDYGICDDPSWAHGMNAGNEWHGFHWRTILHTLKTVGITAESFHPTPQGHERLLEAAAPVVARALAGPPRQPEQTGPIEIPLTSRLAKRYGFGPDGQPGMILQYYPSENTLVYVTTFSVPTIVARVPVQAGVPVDLGVLPPSTLAPGWHLLEVTDAATGRVEGTMPYFIPWPDSCTSETDSDVDGDGFPDPCDGDAADGPLADVDVDGVPNGVDIDITVPDADQADIATDVLGTTATVSTTFTVANAPTGPSTTTTVTILPGQPAKVQVDVRATPSTQPIKGTAKVSFYYPNGAKKTDKSASLKNGSVQINLPTDFKPGVYTVVAEYKPGSGGGPASVSEPVLWTVG